MLINANICDNVEEAYKEIKVKIENKEALNKLKQMITYQKGNSNVIDDYTLFGKTKDEVVVKSKVSGYVKQIRTANIGTAAMILGAGRNTVEDVIDPTVGIKIIAKKGDYLNVGDPIAIIYTNGRNTDNAINMIYDSYVITKDEVKKSDIILDIIGE